MYVAHVRCTFRSHYRITCHWSLCQVVCVARCGGYGAPNLNPNLVKTLRNFFKLLLLICISHSSTYDKLLSRTSNFLMLYSIEVNQFHLTAISLSNAGSTKTISCFMILPQLLKIQWVVMSLRIPDYTS